MKVRLKDEYRYNPPSNWFYENLFGSDEVLEATLLDDDRYTLAMFPGVVLHHSFFDVVESVAPPKVEADPTGKSQHEPGAKADAGKILPALVLGEFAHALEAVVRVGTKGARKYTPRGWLTVPNGQERYAEAAFRHQLEVWKGNRLDDGEGGTGELHKAQVIWNLLAELELELRNGTDK